MPGPWDKYAAIDASAPPAGPWTKYAAPPASTHKSFGEALWDEVNPMNSIPALWHGLTGAPPFSEGVEDLKAHPRAPFVGPPAPGQMEPGYTPEQRARNEALPHPAEDPPSWGEVGGHFTGQALNALLLAAAAHGATNGAGWVYENAGDIGAGMAGAAKGAAKAVTAPVKYRGVTVPGGSVMVGAAGGGIAAGELGLPHAVGAVAGGAIPIVRGAVTGARAALAERAAAEATAARLPAPGLSAADEAFMQARANRPSPYQEVTPAPVPPETPPAAAPEIPPQAAPIGVQPSPVVPAPLAPAPTAPEALLAQARDAFDAAKAARNGPAMRAAERDIKALQTAPLETAPVTPPPAPMAPPEPAQQADAAPTDLERQLQDSLDEVRARKAATAEGRIAGNRATAATRWVDNLKSADMAAPALDDEESWARLARNMGERKSYTPSADTRQLIHERMGQAPDAAESALRTRLKETLAPPETPAPAVETKAAAAIKKRVRKIGDLGKLGGN